MEQDGGFYFIDHLHIGPMKFNVSTQYSYDEDKEIPFLLNNGFIKSLLSVDNLELKLPFVDLEDKRMQLSGLNPIIVTTYRDAMIKQFYKIVLGMDIIGRPSVLVSNLLDGIGDLFYEPINGATMGPSEFFDGIRIGSKSFTSSILGGVSDSFSRFTQAVGSGIANLTFDTEYQQRRQKYQAELNRGDAADAVAGAVTSFGKGIFEGISGLVLDPYHGAEKDGAKGFFINIGRGFAGLLTKPLIGTTDLVQGIFSVVSKLAKESSSVMVYRQMRVFDSNGKFEHFNPLRSAGVYLLKVI